MPDLYWATSRCTASDALTALSGVHTVLAATPTEHIVAVGLQGALRTADADPWPLPVSCFQLTAFDGVVEMRWLADGDVGCAVWLAEDPTLLPQPPAEPPIVAADHIDTRMVLWGRATGKSIAGFSEWSDGRIGQAGYPVAPGVARHDRPCLLAREYIVCDEHGNASVAERRLLRMVTLDLEHVGGEDGT